MGKPDNIKNVMIWVGSHKSEKKTAAARANLQKARTVRKKIQESGVKCGGWKKGRLRGKREKK